MQAAASTLGLDVSTLEIHHARDIAPAFETLKGRSQALYVCTDALANTNRIGINILAVGARLPTMHGSRDYIEAGGLISYGPNFRTCFGAPQTMSTRFYAGRAGRYPGRTTDQVRSRNKPEYGEGARPRSARDAACPRQRGDRVVMQFAALHESGCGTKRRKPRRRVYVSFCGSSGSAWTDGLGRLRRF